MKIYIYNFIRNMYYPIYIDFLIFKKLIRSEKYRLFFNINNFFIIYNIVIFIKLYIKILFIIKLNFKGGITDWCLQNQGFIL